MRSWRLLWIQARRHLGPLSLLIGLSFLAAALAAATPWPLKLIVDNVLAGRPLPDSIAWIAGSRQNTSATMLLAVLAAASALIFALSRLVQTAGRYVQTGVASRMVYGLALDLFNHLQAQSLLFHGRGQVGDLVRRVMSDSDCLRRLVVGVVMPALTAIITLVMMLAIMWRLSPGLSLIALAVAIPLALAIRFLAPIMAERTYRQQQLEAAIMTTAEQTLSALPVVQAFGREPIEDRRFRSLAENTVGAYRRLLATQLQFKTVVGATTAAGTAAIILIGGFQVLDDTLTVGGMIVALAYLAALYAPIETLAYLSEGYAEAAARTRRVVEILDRAPDVLDPPRPRSLPNSGPLSGEVRLSAVTFGYDPQRPILKDLDFVARRGELVALVGRTGAGKSTLVSLIPRFMDVLAGSVTVAGADVRELRIKDLRSQIALVTQEPFLLPLSVAENIAYGRPEATRMDIVVAAQAANADDFIRALPDGYDTVIGERGASLSGGERQRLAIARAFLKDAPILILDEPTSALDAQTEQDVMGAIGQLIKGRTTIAIAHRLSTVRRADRVVVLDEGRIVEEGTHDELVHESRIYGALWRQFTGEQIPQPAPTDTFDWATTTRIARET